MRTWDFVRTPFGRGWAAVEDGELVEFRFRAPARPEGRRDPASVAPFRRRLERYFKSGRGTPGPFRLPGGSGFARAVYREVSRIPRGRVRTYGDIARAVGNPGAARAVGQLMARNPVCLAVPCHRVVGSGGRLGGFTGGLDRKRRLLALEGVPGYA